MCRRRPSSQLVPSIGLATLGVLLGLVAGSASDFPVGAATLEPSPWPTALHDNAHTSVGETVGPQSGSVLWRRQLEGNVTPGPVVAADGTIYIATNAGVLHALDPATGADRWAFTAGSAFSGEVDLSVSPLVLASGSILWPGPRNILYEVSSSGKMQWSHAFGGAVLSPTLSGSTVYVMTMSGTLSSINVGGAVPSVGWSLRLGKSSFGSPVVDADGNVITTVDRKVVAVADHGTSGSVRWSDATSATIEVSPSVSSNGDVFVTDNHADVYDIRPNGTVAWRKRVGQESYSSSAVTSAGILYFGDNGGNLNLVRSTTGVLIRQDHGAKGLWGAQAIDEKGDVYFGTQGKGIYGFNGRGQLLFHLKSKGAIDSYPALTGNGVLIIGDESGVVYAIE
jgi:outer membrane protein assembly factor BamB